MQGIVTKSTGSWCTVKIENGEKIECRLKGIFRVKEIKNTNPVAVGDIVSIEMEKDGRAIITKIEERKNYIIRKATKLSKQTHIIAANVDQAILVVTIAVPETYTSFIDRFLVTAEAYKIPATLIFNKIDLYEEPDLEIVAYLMSIYEEIGYTCIETSVTSKINISEFKSLLKNKTSMISGHSGVGKSSLVNAVEPNLDVKIGDISIAHLSGIHTTTFAEMYDLSFGGQIIDTPGIKSFGVVEVDKNELFHYFPEIFKISHQCKYNNCVHINEPDCAVKNALEAGEIAEHRYRNYYNMYNDENLKYR